jgi:hypothetical protein
MFHLYYFNRWFGFSLLAVHYSRDGHFIFRVDGGSPRLR